MPHQFGIVGSPAKGSSSLKKGLISHWRMDEVIDSRFDSHSSNTLIASGSGLQSVDGKILNALNTTTSGHHLIGYNNEMLQTGLTDFTVAFWVNFQGSFTADRYYLSKDGVTTTTREWLAWFNNSTKRFAFSVGRTGSTTTDVVNATDFGEPTIGHWYFVVCWYHYTSARRVCIQINNTEPAVLTGKTIDPPKGTTNLLVGRITTLSSNQLNGYMDSLSFWKRYLTQEERSRLWNSGAGLDYSEFESLRKRSIFIPTGTLPTLTPRSYGYIIA